MEEINKTDLVVDVAVCEHGVEILHALASTAVIIVLQSFLDGAHVHRLFNDFIVILKEIKEQVFNVSKFSPGLSFDTLHVVSQSKKIVKDIKHQASLQNSLLVLVSLEKSQGLNLEPIHSKI